MSIKSEGLKELVNNPVSRRAFARKTMAGSLAAAGLLATASSAEVFAQTVTDEAVLNFALNLEYLEAEFYTVAERNNFLRGEAAEFAKVVGSHERDHVAALEKVLGDKKVKKPTFDFGNAVRDQATFLATAIVLEDTGVSAYNGAGKYLRDTNPLLVAGKIVSVEARHASAIRDLLNPKSMDFAGDDVVDAQGLDVVREPAEVLPLADPFVVNAIDASGLPTA